jgi:hypothetical protein
LSTFQLLVLVPVLEVGEDGMSRLELPRPEVGAGITLALAMTIARKPDVDLHAVRERPPRAAAHSTHQQTALRTLAAPLDPRHRGPHQAPLVATAAHQWGQCAQHRTMPAIRRRF